MMIPIDLIAEGTRLRHVDEGQVDALVQSISEIGILNPILVYKRSIIPNYVAVDGYGLVCGLHRLYACRKLGMIEVPAIVTDMSDLQRQLAECDENLCGTNLSKAERAMFTRRRKDIYIALYPETRHGGDRKSSRQLGDLIGNGREKSRQLGDSSFPDRFTADTAARSGQSERAVQRDAERGEKIAEEAIGRVVNTKLDNGAYLDGLKRLSRQEQIEQVERDLVDPGRSKSPVKTRLEREQVILAEFRKFVEAEGEDAGFKLAIKLQDMVQDWEL